MYVDIEHIQLQKEIQDHHLFLDVDIMDGHIMRMEI